MAKTLILFAALPRDFKWSQIKSICLKTNYKHIFISPKSSVLNVHDILICSKNWYR